LKPIKGDFEKEINSAGQEAFFQLNIDDNLFNSVSSILVSIDQMFSLRDIAKFNKNAQPFLNMMTTTTVGTILPQFTEEYGQNKQIDLVVSPSHELFLDGIPNAKMSGIYVDKNGNWKVQLNINI